MIFHWNGSERLGVSGSVRARQEIAVARWVLSGHGGSWRGMAMHGGSCALPVRVITGPYRFPACRAEVSLGPAVRGWASQGRSGLGPVWLGRACPVGVEGAHSPSNFRSVEERRVGECSGVSGPAAARHGLASPGMAGFGRAWKPRWACGKSRPQNREWLGQASPGLVWRGRSRHGGSGFGVIRCGNSALGVRAITLPEPGVFRLGSAGQGMVGSGNTWSLLTTEGLHYEI